jgi:hypothetical protein
LDHVVNGGTLIFKKYFFSLLLVTCTFLNIIEVCQQLPGCAISRYFIFSNFAGNTTVVVLQYCIFGVALLFQLLLLLLVVVVLLFTLKQHTRFNRSAFAHNLNPTPPGSTAPQCPTQNVSSPTLIKSKTQSII